MSQLYESTILYSNLSDLRLNAMHEVCANYVTCSNNEVDDEHKRLLRQSSWSWYLSASSSSSPDRSVCDSNSQSATEYRTRSMVHRTIVICIHTRNNSSDFCPEKRFKPSKKRGWEEIQKINEILLLLLLLLLLFHKTPIKHCRLVSYACSGFYDGCGKFDRTAGCFIAF